MSGERDRPLVLFAQIGARRRYADAVALERLGMLARLCTDFWAPAWLRLLASLAGKRVGPLQPMAGRHADGVPAQKVVAFHGLGLRLGRALSRAQGSWERSEVLAEYGSAFARRLTRLVRVPHTHFLGFQSECLEMLRDENAAGRATCLLQYDAADDYDLIAREERDWPEWNRDEGRRSPRYLDRVYAEWHEAQTIIVHSGWTRQQIIAQGAAESKIRYLPLACKVAGQPWAGARARDPRVLRVLYVGSVTLRKGVQYLIEAARMLPPDSFQFTLVGSCRQPPAVTHAFPPHVRVVGQVPYADLQRFYRESDVLVFPTVSDGFGRVQIEALAHGVPVIATTACAEVVRDGETGFRVPPRDPDAIARHLMRLHQERELLEAMSAAAQESAMEWSVPALAQEMAKLLHEVDARLPSDSAAEAGQPSQSS